jgi:hypothetical protein
MSTFTSVLLPESLQPLVDSRLDTIDRMLLWRLARSERLEIVREVESQIFELLGERGAHEPTRDDVLAVLAQLDPPEAYLPSELGDEPAHRPRPVVGRVGEVPVGFRTRSDGPAKNRSAVASTILGIASVVLLILNFPLVIALANMNLGELVLVPWYFLTLLAFIGSVTGVSLATYCRLKGSWAITGFVTGLLALLGSLAFSVLGMFL